MLIVIITVILMSVAQMLIGSLWYSKLLFGNLFMALTKTDESKINPDTAKKAFVKQGVTSLLKSIIVYYLVSQLYFFLPATFFVFFLLILSLTILIKFQSTIWDVNPKPFSLFLVHAGYEIVELTSIFLIAFSIINIF